MLISFTDTVFKYKCKTYDDWINEMLKRMSVIDYVVDNYLVQLNVMIVETFLINVHITIDEDERKNNNYH